MALDLGDPYEFLSSAISPPETNSVRNALLFLDGLSAVYIDDNDDDDVNEIRDGNNDHKKQVKRNNDAAILRSQITPLGCDLSLSHVFASSHTDLNTYMHFIQYNSILLYATM